MSEQVLVRRYLNAYVNCFSKEEQTKSINDLQQVVESFVAQTEVLAALTNPTVSYEQKVEIVKQQLNNAHQLLSNFIYLIIQKKRSALFLSIYNEIENFKMEMENKVLAKVYASSRVNQDEINMVKTYIKDYFKKEVVIEDVIDETILGGVRVETNNVVFDATIDNALQKLKVSFN